MPRYEIEQKYIVKNPLRIRRLLKKMKARKLGEGSEKNVLWDYKKCLFRQASVLRLRTVNGKAVLTFKGPRIKNSRYKKRLECETAVEAKSMEAILRQLGFLPVVGYKKFREEYLLGKSHVTLDYLKGFGWFAEIESDPKNIGILEQKLGLSAADREERSYLELIYGDRSIWAGK